MKRGYIFILIICLIFFRCNGDILEEEGGDSMSAIKLRGIWIVGGLSGSTHGTTVKDVDLYDPVTDAWYEGVTALPAPVSFAGATSIKISDKDHRIYVFGGFDSNGAVKDAVQYYCIESDSWSTGAAITGPRANIYSARLNDRIYVMGGTSTDAASTYTSNTTTYEYNPAGDSWETMTVFGSTASERFMLVSGSVIYNLGGRNAYATMFGTGVLGLNLYQSTTGTETTATETVLSVARTGICGDMYESPDGDVMIIAGGFIGTMTKSATASSVITNTTLSPLNTAYPIQYLAFPFTGTSWTTGSASSSAFPGIGFGSAVVYYSDSLSPNYRFYNFGGTASLASPSATASVGWCNLPEPPNAWTYTWTSVAAMPTGRYGHTAVKIQQ